MAKIFTDNVRSMMVDHVVLLLALLSFFASIPTTGIELLVDFRFERPTDGSKYKFELETPWPSPLPLRWTFVHEWSTKRNASKSRLSSSKDRPKSNTFTKLNLVFEKPTEIDVC